MTTFQQIALLMTAAWFVMVVARFRRSSVVLIGGLCAIGAYTLAAFAMGQVSPGELGLGGPAYAWPVTVGLALAGLAVLLAYSPLADRLASRWFAQPPTLGAFRGLQQSWVNLAAGIVAAWVLGGLLEELIVRGIVLKALAEGLTPVLGALPAAGLAICAAALGAGAAHLYQGPRAVLIITQLSLLLGVLFVVSGYNLWVVILCHGLYDTIAFIRFATRKSKYSRLENAAPPAEKPGADRP